MLSGVLVKTEIKILAAIIFFAVASFLGDDVIFGIIFTILFIVFLVFSIYIELRERKHDENKKYYRRL